MTSRSSGSRTPTSSSTRFPRPLPANFLSWNCGSSSKATQPPKANVLSHQTYCPCSSYSYQPLPVLRPSSPFSYFSATDFFGFALSLVAALLVAGHTHMVVDVYARKIHELERAYRVAQSRLARRVYVLKRGHAVLVEIHSLVHQSAQDAVSDKARDLFFEDDGCLTDSAGQLDGGLYGGVRGLGVAYHFDALHHQRGVEEVHVAHSVGPASDVGDARAHDGRGVGRQYRMLWGHFVEPCEDVALDV